MSDTGMTRTAFNNTEQLRTSLSEMAFSINPKNDHASEEVEGAATQETSSSVSSTAIEPYYHFQVPESEGSSSSEDHDSFAEHQACTWPGMSSPSRQASPSSEPEFSAPDSYRESSVEQQSPCPAPCSPKIDLPVDTVDLDDQIAAQAAESGEIDRATTVPLEAPFVDLAAQVDTLKAKQQVQDQALALLQRFAAQQTAAIAELGSELKAKAAQVTILKSGIDELRATHSATVTRAEIVGLKEEMAQKDERIEALEGMVESARTDKEAAMAQVVTEMKIQDERFERLRVARQQDRDDTAALQAEMGVLKAKEAERDATMDFLGKTVANLTLRMGETLVEQEDTPLRLSPSSCLRHPSPARLPAPHAKLRSSQSSVFGKAFFATGTEREP